MLKWANPSLTFNSRIGICPKSPADSIHCKSMLYVYGHTTNGKRPTSFWAQSNRCICFMFMGIPLMVSFMFMGIPLMVSVPHPFGHNQTDAYVHHHTKFIDPRSNAFWYINSFLVNFGQVMDRQKAMHQPTVHLLYNTSSEPFLVSHGVSR